MPLNEQVLSRYRDHRKNDYSAAESLRWAKNSFINEMEKRLAGFSFGEDGYTRQGTRYLATKDGEVYEVRVEYDSDYNPFEGGYVSVEHRKPGGYPRECVAEVGRNRDTKWIVITGDSPKDAAKYHRKRGMACGPAYEKACAQIIRQRDWAVKAYNGDESYFVVWISKDGKDLDCCGGIEEG